MPNSQLHRDFLLARLRFNGHKLVSIEDASGLSHQRVGQIIRDRMRAAALAVPRAQVDGPHPHMSALMTKPMNHAAYWLRLIDFHERMYNIDTKPLRLNDLKQKAKTDENQPATA